jgi:hypothetical protein
MKKVNIIKKIRKKVLNQTETQRKAVKNNNPLIYNKTKDKVHQLIILHNK